MNLANRACTILLSCTAAAVLVTASVLGVAAQQNGSAPGAQATACPWVGRTPEETKAICDRDAAWAKSHPAPTPCPYLGPAGAGYSALEIIRLCGIGEKNLLPVRFRTSTPDT